MFIVIFLQLSVGLKFFQGKTLKVTEATVSSYWGLEESQAGLGGGCWDGGGMD